MEFQNKMQSMLYNVLELPNDLQIMISEFNPEHREKMNIVLKDLRKYYKYCNFCYKTIVGIIYIEPETRFPFCSSKCIRKHRISPMDDIYNVGVTDYYESDDDYNDPEEALRVSF